MRVDLLRFFWGVRSRGGFTLLEIVITLLVASVCVGLGWQGFVKATESTILRGQIGAISDQGRLAMLRITRELREVTRDPGTVLTPSTEITFSSKATKIPETNPDGDGLVRYYLDGTNLRRKIIATGVDNVLARGISDLTFVADTTDPATFKYVQVQFTVRSLVPGDEYVSYPLRSRIYLRD